MSGHVSASLSHHGNFTWARIGSGFIALVAILVVNAYMVDASASLSAPPLRYESLSSLLKADLSTNTCSPATLGSPASASQQGCNWSNNEFQGDATSAPTSSSVQYVSIDEDPTHSSASSLLLRQLQLQNVPFVIRGNWSAVTLARVRNLWTDEHLSAQFGPRTMQSVQLRHQSFYNPPGVVVPPNGISNRQPLNWTSFIHTRDETVRQFQRGKRVYAYLHATSTESPFLANDLSDLFSSPSPLVDETSDPTFRRSPFAKVQCRFSTPGLQAHAHVDSTDNFLALVSGTKEYILLPPSECAKLQIEGSGAHARQSLLDWNDPLMVQSEAFQSARAVRVTLQAGEVLYVPAYWVHHISSRGSTVAVQCNQRNKRTLRGLQDLHQCHAGFQERYRTNENLKSSKQQEQCAVWPDVEALFAIRSECKQQALCSDHLCPAITVTVTNLPTSATVGDNTISLTLTSTIAASPTNVAKFNMDCTSGTGSARTVFTLPNSASTTTATFNVPGTPNTWTCTLSYDSSSTDITFTICSPTFSVSPNANVVVSTGVCTAPTASLTVPSHAVSRTGGSIAAISITTTSVAATKTAAFNLVCSPVSSGSPATTFFIVAGGSTSNSQGLNVPQSAGSYTCALAVASPSTTDPAFLSSSCAPILSPTSAPLSVTCPSAVVTGLPSSLVVGAPPITLTVTLDAQLGSGTVTFNVGCTPAGGSTATTTAIVVNPASTSGTATFNPPPGSGSFTCTLSIASTSDPNYNQANTQCPPILTAAVPFNFPLTLPSTIYVFGTKLN